MVDLYVYAANGDEAGMVKSQTALFTNDAKGYMTGGTAGATTIAGVSGTLINGVFGKNAGVSQTHEGTAGATVFFPKNDKLFILDSYDKADPAAMQIFDDIVLDFRFQLEIKKEHQEIECSFLIVQPTKVRATPVFPPRPVRPIR